MVVSMKTNKRLKEQMNEGKRKNCSVRRRERKRGREGVMNVREARYNEGRRGEFNERGRESLMCEGTLMEGKV